MNITNRRIQTQVFYLSAILISVISLKTLSAKDSLVIGAFLDGPFPNLNQTKTLVEHEISKLNQSATQIVFSKKNIYAGNWVRKNIEQNFQRLLADSSVDLIIAGGLQSSHIAVKNGPYAKPVIAPFINDRTLQGAPFANGKSGIHNLTYLDIPDIVGRDLRFFHEMTGFKRLAFIIHGRNHAISQLFIRRLDTLSRKLDCRIDLKAVGMTSDSTLAALSDSTDAVYLYSLSHMTSGETQKLVAGLIQKKLPSFSCMGEEDVERGIMVSLNPNPFPGIARRIAVIVQRILMGEDPASFPVHYTVGERLTFNMETARAIGFEPAWTIYNEARIIGKIREKTGKALSLRSAVLEGIKANLDMAAMRHQTKSFRYEKNAAWANLMPRLEMGGRGLLVERELAEASMNTQPQYSGSIYASITQMLFSEAANTNISVQKHRHKAQQYQEQKMKLDIALNIAETYINVLRAGALEAIRRENMERVRSYLQLAKMRVTVGSAGPGEVYRWESEIAGSQKALIEANASRNMVEILLNELLNRPQETSFKMEEKEQDFDSLLSGWTYINDCFKTKGAFQKFRSFMVQEAVKNAPELLAIDEGLAIQSRVLAAANRAFWIPSLAVQGKLENTFYKDGAGSNPPPGAPDDLDWSVAANLSLPIYQGSEAVSKRLAHKALIRQKNSEKASVTNKIEQRIRARLHLAGASFAGIQQAGKAARAAASGLEITKDAYARGAVSIAELTDAQSQYQIAREAESDAVFNYLLALMRVQRASGAFDFLKNAQERKIYRQKLSDWMNKK